MHMINVEKDDQRRLEKKINNDLKRLSDIDKERKKENF